MPTPPRPKPKPTPTPKPVKPKETPLNPKPRKGSCCGNYKENNLVNEGCGSNGCPRPQRPGTPPKKPCRPY